MMWFVRKYLWKKPALAFFHEVDRWIRQGCPWSTGIASSEGKNLAFLQYGFQFRRGQVHEEIIHDSMDAVRERVLEDIRRTGNPTRAIIEGVDDAWEVSILKFSFDMIICCNKLKKIVHDMSNS